MRIFMTKTMKNFRTELKPNPSPFLLNYQTKMLLAGSCFSENIGNLLKINKLESIINPFGIVFNPISLFENLQIFFGQKTPSPDFFLQREQYYFHYDFHSELFAETKSLFLEKIISQQTDNQGFIKSFLEKQSPTQTTASSCLFLTFGTAWVYELKENGHLVTNCHKQNGQLFEKKLLEVGQIVAAFTAFYEQLPTQIPVVLTLSPVRHLKDTFPLNSLSKAVLRVAIHEIIQKYPRTFYFPSYEIFLDDLRDYRFCEPDLLHPNSLAIDYIFDKFQAVFFDEKTKNLLEKWTKVRQNLAHKPFLEKSESYKVFLEKTLFELEKLYELDVKNEIVQLKEKLRIFI